MFLLLVLACGPEAPTRPEDCESLFLFGARAEDCKVEVALHLLGEDRAAGEKYAQEEIENALTRDFVWLQATMRLDPSGYYCGRIDDTTLKARCEDRAKRPHLNRGLVGRDEPGGAGAAGGGPGMGAGGPGGGGGGPGMGAGGPGGEGGGPGRGPGGPGGEGGGPGMRPGGPGGEGGGPGMGPGGPGAEGGGPGMGPGGPRRRGPPGGPERPPSDDGDPAPEGEPTP